MRYEQMTANHSNRYPLPVLRNSPGKSRCKIFEITPTFFLIFTVFPVNNALPTDFTFSRFVAFY